MGSRTQLTKAFKIWNAKVVKIQIEIQMQIHIKVIKSIHTAKYNALISLWAKLLRYSEVSKGEVQSPLCVFSFVAVLSLYLMLYWLLATFCRSTEEHQGWMSYFSKALATPASMLPSQVRNLLRFELCVCFFCFFSNADKEFFFFLFYFLFFYSWVWLHPK